MEKITKEEARSLADAAYSASNTAYAHGFHNLADQKQEEALKYEKLIKRMEQEDKK
jgi:hypothetical protein